MDTEGQHKKQYEKRYDWLKGYQFQPGQSGNPGGMKKGTKTMKRFAREYLENLPDEEKIKFLEALPEELVFRMAEGNPHNTEDHTGKVEVKVIPIYGGKSISGHDSNTQDILPNKED